MECYTAIEDYIGDKITLEDVGEIITPENINIKDTDNRNLLYVLLAQYFMTYKKRKIAEWLISLGCDINDTFNNENCLLHYCRDLSRINCQDIEFFKKLISSNTDFSLQYARKNVIQIIKSEIPEIEQSEWFKVLIINQCPKELFRDSLSGSTYSLIEKEFEKIEEAEKKEAEKKEAEKKEAETEKKETEKKMIKQRKNELLNGNIPSVDGILSSFIESESDHLGTEVNSLDEIISATENNLKTLQHTHAELKVKLAETEDEIQETTDELEKLKEKHSQYKDLAENLGDRLYSHITSKIEEKLEEKLKEKVEERWEKTKKEYENEWKNNLTQEELFKLIQRKLE